MASENPRRLLGYLAEGLVDDPESVAVEQFEEDDGTIVLELCDAADDYGRVIETIGHYNAQTDPSTIVLDEERIRDWLARGAQPSDSVRKLLRTQNIS